MSLATSFKHHWGYWGWGGGDSYKSFVRLRPGVQLDDVNTRIEKLAEQVRKRDVYKRQYMLRVSANRWLLSAVRPAFGPLAGDFVSEADTAFRCV